MGGRSGERGLPGVQGPAGKNGTNGKDGKIGPVGPAGENGKKGPKGDSCKSELQVHLNALKSYVDMKFDVLKGMVDKTMTRTASSGVVEDDDDTSEKMDDLQEQLMKSLTSA